MDLETWVAKSKDELTAWRAEIMPRKIRELIRDLEQAGFVDRGGRGGHRNYERPPGQRVTLSGNSGAGAKPYQEQEVLRAIAESKP
jgi:predicted RNA binding protein YcfA (HicA-like mRNA interferase family)